MIIFLFGILIFVSLFAMFPSFYLGLYGDDWLEIWRFFYTTGADQYGIWGYLGYIFSRYGSFDLIMGILVNIFGYKSVYFYVTAYFLRIIGAISFYPLVFYITKNRLASFFAVLFFSVTAVGLDATNWVFNMPVYLSIAFFNLFLFYLMRSKFEKNEKFILNSLIFFSLAILTAAVRMTGILPLLVLLELFWLFGISKISRAKDSLKRFSVFLLVFVLIVLVGNFFAKLQSSSNFLVGSVGNWSDIFGGGFTSAITLVSQGKIEIIFFPLIMIGNMLIPVELSVNNKWGFLIVGALIYLIGIIFLKKSKDKLNSTGIFLSLVWVLVSFVFAWIRSPDQILPFTHRYLIVPASGLTIFLAILINFGKNSAYSKIIFGMFLVLVVLNIYSTRNYLTNLVENVHGSEISEKIWSQMPQISAMGRSAQPLVFYFEGENKSLLYGVITFGFPYHMGLLYDLDNYHKMPVPMDGWMQLESAVTDGKSLAPYDHPLKPIPLENIYAFRLEGKDKLVNITDEVRLKLLTYTELNSKIH